MIRTTVNTIRRFEWDMAHRIPNHKGKCSRLHGHRYVLEAAIEGEVIQAVGGSSEGMIIDFDDLDEIIKSSFGHWDHRTMLYSGDPLIHMFPQEAHEKYGIFTVPYIPTAENIAACVRGVLILALPDMDSIRVRVWETPKGSAAAF